MSARHVLVNASPQELARLTGDTPPAPAEGAQLKVNMLLTRLPALRDTGVDPREAFSGTFHIAEGYGQLAAAHAQAAAGALPSAPPSEIYCHSLTDPTILGPDLVERGYQTLTLFGLHTPARLFEGDNDGVRDELLKSTLAQLDAHLAEPLEDCLALDADGRPCIEAKTPLDLERICVCPAATSSTVNWHGRTHRRARAAGAWRPRTRTSLCGAERYGRRVSGVPGHNAAMRSSKRRRAPRHHDRAADARSRTPGTGVVAGSGLRGFPASDLTEYQKRSSLLRTAAASCAHADGAEQELGVEHPSSASRRSPPWPRPSAGPAASACSARSATPPPTTSSATWTGSRDMPTAGRTGSTSSCPPGRWKASPRPMSRR